jgi:hypothetical protein
VSYRIRNSSNGRCSRISPPAMETSNLRSAKMTRQARAMLTSEDCKQLAERCVELASECSAPTVAEALRALAVDYLTRAARLRRREATVQR